MKQKIVVLPGDHIGKKTTAYAVKILKIVNDLRLKQQNLELEFLEGLIGGAAIDAEGEPLPESTLKMIDDPETVAVLLGAVGGPEWPPQSNKRPEQGLLQLRKHLNAFANLRPCKFPSSSLVDLSPLKPHLVKNVDFIILRELCSGIYFGEKKEGSQTASDLEIYSRDEVIRVARIAGNLARESTVKRVTSIDKANVLASSRLWQSVVKEVFKKEFPDIELKHVYVDAASMYMLTKPESLNGIVLTNNIFGDILSDEASGLLGSLGLSPSASISGYPLSDKPGLYEPIHGSAPDISGKDIANPVASILSGALLLRYSLQLPREAEAVEKAVQKVLTDSKSGGFGYRTRDMGGERGTKEMGEKICEVLREILGKMSADEWRVQNYVKVPVARPLRTLNRRPLNLIEKIMLHHAVGLQSPNIKPNDLVCLKVDWTLASELTWKGMEKTFDAIDRPPIHRKDRFWLAVDHTVDPRINDQPKPKELIQASESFAKEAELVDYHGPNQTILHTEFYRERAQPGQVIIGADSHSCSAGGLGTLAVGLGAADVVMPLVTGLTWFKVPETCNIQFINKPPFGIGGKDVILWILGQLKRNTVAFERAVEFTGDGCRYLSCDARFAISNMTTEFGGIAGVFQPDEITKQYIDKRKGHKHDSLYFKADSDAEYANTFVIDLQLVDSMVALFPSPDHVVPISYIQGMSLDGVFIGACTTAEEDLIMAGLVLKIAYEQGYRPSLNGKRKMTPGSLSILHKLKRLGLIQIYEQCGFEIGAPGCSYCLGIAADRALEGEVWLSSQNRNFRNRMGKGSFGHLASAVACAASSFEMRVVDPKPYLLILERTDLSLYFAQDEIETKEVLYSEPILSKSEVGELPQPPERMTAILKGRVQLLESHVDTDAIIPAPFMPGTSDMDLGQHCFQYARPEFRQKVKDGLDIVVAGAGFGSGSSREEAVRALKGCGVKAVIAESFAFIYERNQYNMGFLGITIRDWDRFMESVEEGTEVEIDVERRLVTVYKLNRDGVEEVFEFGFELSLMEERMISGGGVTEMYRKYGKDLFLVAIQDGTTGATTIADTNSEKYESLEARDMREVEEKKKVYGLRDDSLVKKHINGGSSTTEGVNCGNSSELM